ncbi:MAG: DUF934 domain-containing protein [Rubrimonas sp.]
MPVITDFGVSLDDGPLAPLGEAADGGSLRVLVPADADGAMVAAQADRFDLIGVQFDRFSDGRGFSLARRLRDLGFRGRLRAVGHLIPDQFAYARACGFDEVQVDDATFARQGEEAWIRAAGAATPPFRARAQASRRRGL